MRSPSLIFHTCFCDSTKLAYLSYLCRLKLTFKIRDLYKISKKCTNLKFYKTQILDLSADINNSITVVFMCRETQNTFATIFGNQRITEKTGRRVFKHSHNNTYDKIFGKSAPRYSNEYTEDDEDTFNNIFGRKRQEGNIQGDAQKLCH